jgi:hypothetical protein
MLLNGSPRGRNANTLKMLTRVAEGWQRGGGATPAVFHLAESGDFDAAIQGFSHADVLLLGMPLYTDSMPAIVKLYIEALAPLAGSGGGPTLGFLVQSGFPEALHSRPLERYLEKLARRLALPYAGTIVHGGGEALHSQPEAASARLWEQLRILGEQLARTGRFGEAELKTIAGVERFSALSAALLSMACRLPILQAHWNSQLKKNGVWERRFAAPYGPAFGRLSRPSTDTLNVPTPWRSTGSSR